MKRLYFIIFISFLLQINILAQSGWYSQPSGTTENLNAVSFFDKNLGIVVGDNGTILRTTNAGTNWVKQLSGVTSNLHNLTFIDLNNIIVIGDSGTIVRTSNGGATWEKLLGVTTASLNGLSFLNNKIGIIVGGTGNNAALILTTTDGGIKWSAKSLSDHFFIPKHVHYQDSTHIVIIGWYSYFDTTSSQSLYSSDGGNTWSWGKQDIINYPSGNITGTSFGDSKNGILVGSWYLMAESRGFIYKTTDGGLSWKGIYDDFRPAIYGVDYITSEIYTIVGTRGNINRSNDGGQTWTNQLSGTVNELYSVYFNDSLTGTVVGANGTILHTIDGGSGGKINNSWEVQYCGVNELLSKVCFADNNTAFAIGDIGTVVKTTDAGNSWKPHSIGTSLLSSVKFLNNYFGVVIGNFPNNLFLTTNGGLNWTIQSLPGGSNWNNDISLIDIKNWIIVGPPGEIFHSSDGGVNWINQNSGTQNTLYRVSFVNADTGFAVGGNVILSTTNGGQQWTTQTSSANYDLNSICCIDSKNVVAVGRFGEVLKTSDGGTTWVTKLEGLNSINLTGVYFSDTSNGVVVGSSGTILKTTNGGNDWIKINVNTQVNLQDVAISDSVVLCVGDHGTIVRYANWGSLGKASEEIPNNFSLKQNYPNPFNPNTTIEYSIPEQLHVTIKIYDLLGREVTTLVNEEKRAGNYKVNFNAGSLPSGVYFYRLEAGGFISAKKLLLLK